MLAFLAKLIPIIRPFALDFIMKRTAKASAALISKPQNKIDMSITALRGLAELTPGKRDDKWARKLEEVKPDVDAMIKKLLKD